ncbi:MAG TPA: hypothetical protein DCS93_05350 [Microscillaceae bacterium]|nr:hypothetical protein [Microscillaceae bacterium]
MNAGCTEKYLQGKLVKNSEIDLGVDEIYQKHMYMMKNTNLIQEKEDLAITSIDSSNKKNFEIEVKYFIQDDNQDIVQAKATLLIQLGKINIKGRKHWFPIAFKSVGYTNSKRIIFRIHPNNFLLALEKKNHFIIRASCYFLLGKKGTSKYPEEAGKTNNFDAVTKYMINIRWDSTDNKLITTVFNKPLAKVSDYVRFPWPWNSLKYSILQTIFHTDEAVQERFRVISK